MRDKQKVKAYNAKYRKENAEKIKKIQADYYAKHREARIKNAQEWVKKNPNQFRTTRSRYIKSKQGRLTSIKSSAKTRNIEFLLTQRQAMQLLGQNCFYCGDDKEIGIDRIDSKLGYTLENSVACCTLCNYMKRTYSKDQFIAQCIKISEFQKHSV